MKQVILLHIVHILNSVLFIFFNIYDTLNLWFEIWKIFCCLGILNKLKMLLDSDNDLISLSFFSLCCRQEKAELAHSVSDTDKTAWAYYFHLGETTNCRKKINIYLYFIS